MNFLCVENGKWFLLVVLVLSLGDFVMKVVFVVDGVEEGGGEEGGEVREEHKQKRRGFQQDRLGAVSHCSYSLRRLGRCLL